MDDLKYPIQAAGARQAGQAGDYRFRRGEDHKLELAMGLPTKRRGPWQGVLLAVLAGALVGLLALWPQAAGAGELPFRLHIIANSDSAADQAVKLQVRDAVVEYLTPLVSQAADSAEAEAIVAAELPNLERLAAGICQDYGYGCRGEVGSFDFPAKRYGQTVLPAGEYRALRLNLGEAAGHNWWCVIFPPLCFVDECGELSAVDAAAGENLLGADRVVRLKICEVFNQAL